LPELGVEQAAEALAAEEAVEACGAKGGLGIGEAGDAEASEYAEGEVQRADVERGDWAQGGLAGDGEVGEQPEGSGLERSSQAMGEGGKVGLGEAVEEKVGDDEVGVGFGGQVEGRGLEGLQLSAWGGAEAALAEEMEHGGAGVDGQDVEVRLVVKEFSEEATVAIAEDEGVGARGELRKEVGAGALEERAEGEVFGPAVETRDAIEVGLRGAHRAEKKRRGRKRSGVRRTRSAAARR
jgi:hypothetical protein